MIDLSTRPELAALDALTTAVVNHTYDFTGLDGILNEFPVVRAALLDRVEPEDEVELARQATQAYEQIMKRYADRIPMQYDEDGYIDETQAWELAERIYSAVYGYDDRRHWSQMTGEIMEWLCENDWREDQIPAVDALVAEWREYAGEA